MKNVRSSVVDRRATARQDRRRSTRSGRRATDPKPPKAESPPAKKARVASADRNYYFSKLLMLDNRDFNRHTLGPMAWRCPACQTEVRHGRESLFPNRIYRCHVCHLELVLDPEEQCITVAPMPTDPPRGAPRQRRVT